MTYYKTITLQAGAGLLIGILGIIFPNLLLEFISPAANGDVLTTAVLRLGFLFLVILCLVLLATRPIKNAAIQKQLLLINSVFDLLGATFILYLTVDQVLAAPTGYILGGIYALIGLGYLPSYFKIK